MGNFNKFSTISKFASFYEEPIWCDVIIIDEVIFSQNQIFNKKWNPYVNLFLVSCLAPFVTDVIFVVSNLCLREFLLTV